MSELKSCPFCGGAVEMRDPYPKWEDYGIVYDCMIIHTCKSGFDISIYTKHGYKTPDEARKAMAEVWNNRICPACSDDTVQQPCIDGPCASESRQLTLDELRQMDGRPVYIVELCPVPYNRWEILDRECPVDMEAQDVNFEGGDCYATYTLGKRWAAFDRPPGGERHA